MAMTGSLVVGVLFAEGVAWAIPVEPQPLSMSAAQVAAFAAIHPHKCRPVQPLGERVLYSS